MCDGNFLEFLNLFLMFGGGGGEGEGEGRNSTKYYFSESLPWKICY
jgi:hypothetical protein